MRAIEEDAVLARAARLLGETGPLPVSAQRRARVLMRLTAKDRASTFYLRLRPLGVVAIVFLLVVVGSAGATVAKWALRHRHANAARATALARVASGGNDVAPRADVALRAEAAPRAGVATRPDGTAAQITHVQTARVPAPRSIAVIHARDTRATDVPTPSIDEIIQSPYAPPVDDAAIILRAAHALRVDGNIDVAQSQLTTYLDNHPHGSLREEALALLIEAHGRILPHVSRDAAQKYLHEFPNGRFVDAARAIVN
jgi:hypothetical protein